ncbi:unnamed protein product [Amoebophrya sp. A25]|nr:unnamed protein product [Amoebophrya sp. A25]|eukprot:GSA25T00005199001.1
MFAVFSTSSSSYTLRSFSFYRIECMPPTLKNSKTYTLHLLCTLRLVLVQSFYSLSAVPPSLLSCDVDWRGTKILTFCK